MAKKKQETKEAPKAKKLTPAREGFVWFALNGKSRSAKKRNKAMVGVPQEIKKETAEHLVGLGFGEIV